MYAKVFNQIFDSSIADDYRVRQFFVDLLVLADVNGVVDMTANAISGRTRVPIELVKEFLTALAAPDPESRTPIADGRRIVLLDEHRTWGWQIVNYDRFRKTASEEQRREKTKERVDRFRDKNGAKSKCNATETPCNVVVTPVNASNAMQKQSVEADAKAEEHTHARSAGANESNFNPRRPNSIEQCIEKGSILGLTEQQCREWFRDCEVAEWRRGDGTLFDNWPKQLTIHRENLKANGHKPGSTTTPSTGLSGIDKSISLRELEGVEKKIADIKNSYSGFQEWDEMDREKMKELKARRTELRTTLGMKL